MGSAKYPAENGLDVFLSQNGGSLSNAHTDMERTAYIFEVAPHALAEALDRLAQFFIAPLMSDTLAVPAAVSGTGSESGPKAIPEGSITRELSAIDSEFEMARFNDSCRKDFLIQTLAPKGHPLSTFPWGNTLSLRTSTVPFLLPTHFFVSVS